jgi:hypothetical protein
MPVTDLWWFEEYADETTVFELFDHKPFNSSVFETPVFYKLMNFFLSPRILQSVRRHSAIVLTGTVYGMQEIHPVIYSY